MVGGSVVAQNERDKRRHEREFIRAHRRVVSQARSNRRRSPSSPTAAGRILYANQATAEIHRIRHRRDPASGSSKISLKRPSSQRMVAPDAGTPASTRVPSGNRSKSPIRRKDGERRWIAWTKYSHRSAGWPARRCRHRHSTLPSAASFKGLSCGDSSSRTPSPTSHAVMLALAPEDSRKWHSTSTLARFAIGGRRPPCTFLLLLDGSQRGVCRGVIGSTTRASLTQSRRGQNPWRLRH